MPLISRGGGFRRARPVPGRGLLATSRQREMQSPVQMTGRPVFEEVAPPPDQAQVEQERFLRAAQRMPMGRGGG